MSATRLAAMVLLLAAPVFADEKPPARVDQFGDPLPEGAVARLGTVRFRMLGSCLAFSFDGKFVVTGNYDRTASMWDLEGREVRRFQGKNLGQVWRVALSPDGNTLATFDVDNGVMLWETRTGKFLRVMSEKYQERTFGRTGFTFSPDSRTLFVGEGKTFRAFNVADGKVVNPPTPPERELTIDGVSPDGTTAVSVAEGGRLVVWNLATGKAIGEVTGPGGRGFLALSPGGKRLARGIRGDGSIDVYDVTTGKELCRCKGHKAAADAMAFFLDGRTLVTASYDLTVRGWDADTGKELWSYRQAKFGSPSVAFAPDGKRVGVLGGDGIVRLLDAATGKDQVPTAGHRSGVHPLAVSPDGQAVFTSSHDQSIRMWDLASGKELHMLRPPGRDEYDPETQRVVHAENYVYCLQATPEGKSLFVGESPGARLWDVSDPSRPRPGKRLDDGFASCLSPDGKTVVLTDNTIRFVDVMSGKVVRERKSDGAWGTPALSPDGRVLAVGGHKATIHLFEARTLRPMATMRNGDGDSLTHTVFSPDGQLVASSGLNWRIDIWEVASGRLWKSVQQPRGAGSAIAFSPDARYLAMLGKSGEISLYDLASGQVAHIFRGHDGISCLAFTPNGRRLISGGGDTTALVWDMGVVSAPKRKGVERTAKELDSLWENLGEVASSADAIQSLTASPEQAAEFLARRLKPADKEKQKRLALLVRDLDSDLVAEREQATAALQDIGADAAELLLDALADVPTPEMERRAGQLLDRLKGKPSPDRLRSLRAVQVLAWIGTPAARKTLEAVAAGAPDAELTRAATAALACLDRW
jgi:WD40 repeat protein